MADGDGRRRRYFEAFECLAVLAVRSFVVATRMLCCNTVLLRSRTLRATGHLHSRVSPLGVLLLCLAVSSANTRLLPLPPSSSTRGWAHPATSAPGLGSPLPPPHLRWDRAHPCHTSPPPPSGAPLARVVAHALRGRLRVARRETRSERSAERDDSPSAACVAYLGRRWQRRRGKAQARLPVPAQMWPQQVPVRMWQGSAQSRCRCGRGEPCL